MQNSTFILDWVNPNNGYFNSAEKSNTCATEQESRYVRKSKKNSKMAKTRSIKKG